MIPRPDLLDKRCPTGIEVFQLTHEKDVPSCHIYMEAQIFTPDSKKFVLHRSAGPHGSDKRDAEHQYLVCDLENECSMSPITSEPGTTGPAISPDGKHFYYFVNETHTDSSSLILKRVDLDGSNRQTVACHTGAFADSGLSPRSVYPLSTIRSDGEKIAICGFMGNGDAENGPFGLWVFDIERGDAQCVLHGSSWCNIHPQYCRSQNADHMRDILIQENHGCETSKDGKNLRSVSGAGADIHVISDDGSNFRDLPWGRDMEEGCQGHQCWRGREHWAITGNGIDIDEHHHQQLIESLPVEAQGHIGRKSEGGIRNELSREFERPHFCHFGTDIAGKHLITDHRVPDDGVWHLYAADFGEAGVEPLQNLRYLVNTGSSLSGLGNAHTHPFLSPDGKRAFFNSDESGVLQAYMITGVN